MEGSLENLKRDVQCFLCKDTLTEPKILKCFHSFCKPCIKRHAELIQEVNVFKCPKCKSETPLPELNSVDDLKPSVLYSRMVKVLEFVESEKVCCVSGSHPPASWHCLDCNRSLCDECEKGHSMFTKDHKGIALSKEVKAEDIKLLLTRENNCAFHADKIVELFCKDCEKMVCMECLQGDHDEHSTVSLAKYTEKNKDQLSEELQKLKALEKGMEMEVKVIEAETSELKANGERSKRLVEETLQKMFETLQKNAQELLNQIDDNIDKAEKRKIRGQSVLDQTRGAIEYTKTLIENGVSSEVMENEEIKKASSTSFDSVVGARCEHILFFPNRQLEKDMIKSELGVLQEVADPKMSRVDMCGRAVEGEEVKLIVTTCLASGKRCGNSNDDIDVKIHPLNKVQALRKIVRTDGEIEVKFKAKVAGQLTAEVQVNGKHVSKSPLVVYVKPQEMCRRMMWGDRFYHDLQEVADPKMSSVDVCSRAVEGEEVILLVTTCTASGKRCGVSKYDIDVKIHPLDTVQALQKFVRTDSRIEVTFIPIVPDCQLTVEVQVNGKHVSNSPLSAYVRAMTPYETFRRRLLENLPFNLHGMKK